MTKFTCLLREQKVRTLFRFHEISVCKNASPGTPGSHYLILVKSEEAQKVKIYPNLK